MQCAWATVARVTLAARMAAAPSTSCPFELTSAPSIAFPPQMLTSLCSISNPTSHGHERECTRLLVLLRVLTLPPCQAVDSCRALATAYTIQMHRTEGAHAQAGLPAAQGDQRWDEPSVIRGCRGAGWALAACRRSLQTVPDLALGRVCRHAGAVAAGLTGATPHGRLRGCSERPTPVYTQTNQNGRMRC